MADLLYVTAFMRWRSAPPKSRVSIAREQSWLPVKTLFPDDLRDKDRIADAIMPNGKRGADCAEVELAEIADWARAIVKAARDRAEAVDLLAAASKFRI
jgi:hypothetical protein